MLLNESFSRTNVCCVCERNFSLKNKFSLRQGTIDIFPEITKVMYIYKITCPDEFIHCYPVVSTGSSDRIFGVYSGVLLKHALMQDLKKMSLGFQKPNFYQDSNWQRVRKL